MIEYQHLDLGIEGDEAAGYTVTARLTPAGTAATAPAADMASVAAAIDLDPLAGLQAELEILRTGAAEPQAMQAVGQALYRVLFPREVLAVYQETREQLGEGQGVSLRLHLPPDLAYLPWELLYVPPFYLAADPTSPVVRFLDLPDAPRPQPVAPPLRLLHVVAEPLDAQPLEVGQEAALLRAALAEPVGQGRVEIRTGGPGTLAAFLENIQDGCHIFHFTGHGAVIEGEGYLIFEGKDGLSDPVGAGRLAQLLRGTGVRLALLNACESASVSDSDAFGSVAAALSRAGLPAVVAHQLAMPDRSALPFAAAFYRALARGQPVDAAVVEGRKAILAVLDNDWQGQMDWAIPVLLLNVPEVQLLPPGALVEDDVPELLEELRRMVGKLAPREKRRAALDRVAALSEAAGTSPPDLDAVEAVLDWFRAEVYPLLGAVLTVVAGIRPRVAAAGEELSWEFEDRFGPFPE